jgi:hypothetical protein
MTQRFILAAAIAVAASQSITAFAGASDYVFEAVSTTPKNVPNGFNVADAFSRCVWFRSGVQ